MVKGGEYLEYIKINNSSLIVSRLCMGGCPLGGYGWGNVEEKNLISSIKTALDSGINFFDTADTYGLGNSERLLGKALGSERKNVIIQDKFGVRACAGKPTVYDNSRKYIIKACDESLMRLNTDYIDIYAIHYRDGKTPLGDVVDTLEYLKKCGKIRYFGLSNIHGENEAELIEYKDKFVTFQDEYSLACRKNEKEMFKFRDEYGFSPLTWGSLGQGILTGKYNESNVNFGSDDRRSRDIYVNFHGEKLKQNLKIVEVLKQIAAEHNKPVSSVAIRFILDYIKDSGVLVGIKSPAQVLQNVEALGWHISTDEINSLLKVSSL